MNSDIKHIMLFFLLIIIIGTLTYNLESSKLNYIKELNLFGNNLLTENNYLEFAQLSKIDEKKEITISLIRDRLEKHPYIENVEVFITERGVAEINIFEKNLDAILLGTNEQFLISEFAELLPFIASTRNIDLPIITDNKSEFRMFENGRFNEKLLCALNIITASKLFDKTLYENISEIDLNDKNKISIYLSEVDAPIYFGLNDEIEKTVYLSKIFNQIKNNQISDYIDYIDLRYKNFVYLGFDEQLTKDEGKI